MMWTQKEASLLTDLKSQEQICVEKYGEYAQRANDPELKNIFSSIRDNEQQHLQTITDMLNGQMPQPQQGQQQQKKPSTNPPPQGNAVHSPQWQEDNYLCLDALSTEKHVSNTYDVAIFEFRAPAARDALYEIQGAEQRHGEQIYAYMAENGMQA